MSFLSPVFSFFASLIFYYQCVPTRLCVSASQDGKLIVWDSITTNKVKKRAKDKKTPPVLFIDSASCCRCHRVAVHSVFEPFHLSSVSPGKRHPSQVILGHDLCLCTFRKPCGLWRSGQHVLYLQPQGQGWECQGHA